MSLHKVINYPDREASSARALWCDLRILGSESAIWECVVGIWGNRTHRGKVHGRGLIIIKSLRSTLPVILGASMAYGFCRKWQGLVLRSARRGGCVAGQGWHTGKTVF